MSWLSIEMHISLLGQIIERHLVKKTRSWIKTVGEQGGIGGLLPMPWDVSVAVPVQPKIHVSDASIGVSAAVELWL